MAVFHRFGIFHLDGTAFGPGSTCTPDGTVMVTPGRVVREETPGLYVLPMDDRPADWDRLFAAYQAGLHLGLTHVNGVDHPELGHVKLGGQLSWDAPPHEGLSTALTVLAAMSDHDHIRFQTGEEPLP